MRHKTYPGVCRRRLPPTVELGSVRHTADRIDRRTFVLTGSQRTAGGHQTRAQLLLVKCGSKCRAKPASRTWPAPACASKAPCGAAMDEALAASWANVSAAACLALPTAIEQVACAAQQLNITGPPR